MRAYARGGLKRSSLLVHAVRSKKAKLMDQSKEARRLDRLSRRLVKVLRHTAIEDGLPMGRDGYVCVTKLRSLPHFSAMTDEDLRLIVRNCPKQRFGLKQNRVGELLVRANQGHSMKMVVAEELLERVSSPDEAPVAVHGTTYQAWRLIRAAGGLSKMNRTHVHFASGEPGADGIISGMRCRSEVLCFLDVPQALAEGLPLFLSDNGVILSPGMPIEPAAVDERASDASTPVELVPLHLLRVLHRKTREVLWEPEKRSQNETEIMAESMEEETVCGGNEDECRPGHDENP